MRLIDLQDETRRDAPRAIKDRSKSGSAWASDQTLWRHRITEADYQALLDAQDGRCAICFAVDKRLVVDHDHDCCNQGKFVRTCGFCIRGLVCHGCNMLIGFLERRPADEIVRAVRYIDGHNPRGVGHGVANQLTDTIGCFIDYARESRDAA